MMNKLKEAGKKLAKKTKSVKNWMKVAGVGVLMEMNSMVCYADSKSKPKEVSSDSVTEGISNLSNFVLAIIAGVGIIFVAKSTFEFASSYQSNDSSGMSSAVKGIIGGLMMISITGILKLLGVM